MAGVRCTQSNQFTSLEPGKPEVQDSRVDGAEWTATVRVVLNCANCGEELKAQELTIDQTVDHDCTQDCNCDGGNCLECGGKGNVPGDVCPECQGSGQCQECGGDGETHPARDDPDYAIAGDAVAEFVEDAETTVRRGKKKGQKITNPRYQTRLYGATVTQDLTCNHCNETVTVQATETAPASSFDTVG